MASQPPGRTAAIILMRIQMATRISTDVGKRVLHEPGCYSPSCPTHTLTNDLCLQPRIGVVHPSPIPQLVVNPLDEVRLLTGLMEITVQQFIEANNHLLEVVDFEVFQVMFKRLYSVSARPRK